MISQKPLASAMMVPTRQVTIPTGAGRSVRFSQGIATINDTNDLPVLLGREDVKVMFTDYAASWLSDILAATPTVRADVHWPAGYAPPAAPEETPNQPVQEQEPQADPPENALDQALKGRKKAWQRPPSN